VATVIVTPSVLTNLGQPDLSVPPISLSFLFACLKHFHGVHDVDYFEKLSTRMLSKHRAPRRDMNMIFGISEMSAADKSRVLPLVLYSRLLGFLCFICGYLVFFFPLQHGTYYIVSAAVARNLVRNMGHIWSGRASLLEIPGREMGYRFGMYFSLITLFGIMSIFCGLDTSVN